jgi:glycogen synthase
MPGTSDRHSLHVLMTADTVGGVWTYALQLATALCPHGVMFTLATLGAPLSDEQRKEATRVPNLKICESSFKLEWMDDPWDDVAESGRWLLELEQQVRPDLIHLNGYSHAALPWSAPTLAVAHSCVLSWWRAVHHQDAPAEWDVYRDMVATGLRAAQLVVAPTKAMLSALRDHYGLLSSSRVIHNGRQISRSSRCAKEKLILAAGRLWDGAKNIAALNEAAPGLRWPVFIAGESARPNGGEARHCHLNHLGRLSSDALLSWYDRASIYALPARYEPFGLSVLEAALAGCALVLGDIPSLRELWGDAAVFVPPEDTKALGRALNSLANSPQKTSAFAGKAIAAARRFTAEGMAQNYLSAYADLQASSVANVFLETVTE